MSVITRVPEANLWDTICKGFLSQRPPYDDDTESVATVEHDYDPAKHNPVFFSNRDQLASKVTVDGDPLDGFDSSKFHPSVAGYSFVKRPPKTPPPPPPTPPDHKTCPPRVFLEHYVFPILLPAMEEMLRKAKEEKCFERKRTKFNALDFLTEYLYSHNPKHSGRDGVTLEKIPFVEEHWKEHPRPPLPKSLIWSEEEAMLIIQSFFRGFKVRCEPDVQELRQWQKEWREENSNITEKVDSFWSRQMGSGGGGGGGGGGQEAPPTRVESVTKSAGAAAGGSSRPVSRSVTILSPTTDHEGL